MEGSVVELVKNILILGKFYSALLYSILLYFLSIQTDPNGSKKKKKRHKKYYFSAPLHYKITTIKTMPETSSKAHYFSFFLLTNKNHFLSSIQGPRRVNTPKKG